MDYQSTVVRNSNTRRRYLLFLSLLNIYQCAKFQIFFREILSFIILQMASVSKDTHCELTSKIYLEMKKSIPIPPPKSTIRVDSFKGKEINPMAATLKIVRFLCRYSANEFLNLSVLFKIKDWNYSS